ncbi:helix-turn-helix domain-containing protein [Nocardia thailandica]|uniref:Helix-turn-helix domain-containing protein n=1 Tax=Nocardia thailandica TaxID=257275 RepID=A0ABW6PI79_9NOCA
MSTPDTPRLSLAQAAARYDVSVDTLRRWIRKGRLPAVRVGPRLIRVTVADLDALTAPVGPAAANASTPPPPDLDADRHAVTARSGSNVARTDADAPGMAGATVKAG